MSNNYNAYFALEKLVHVKTGCAVERNGLVSEFSAGQKTGLKDLTPFEYREFLTWIRTKYEITNSNADWQNTPENKMRRKIIGFFKSMQYLDGSAADLDRINDWCIKYGCTKKPLNENSKTELTRLVTQVEKVYQSFIQSL